MDNARGPDDAVTRQLDAELRRVDEAILTVTSGAATAVTIVGLRLAPTILDEARRLALAAGVVLVPLWTIDEHGLDLRVEARP